MAAFLKQHLAHLAVWFMMIGRIMTHPPPLPKFLITFLPLYQHLALSHHPSPLPCSSFSVLLVLINILLLSVHLLGLLIFLTGIPLLSLDRCSWSDSCGVITLPHKLIFTATTTIVYTMVCNEPTEEH